MLREFLNSRRAAYWADLASCVIGRTLIAMMAAIILSLLAMEYFEDATSNVVIVSMIVSMLLVPGLSWVAFRAEQQVMELNARIKAITTVETLPSVLNASFFMNFAERLRMISLRQKRDISLITVEIQHFESLRSVFGRKFGEGLITKFAGLIVRAIRAESDLVCRLHETEFTILLIDADANIGQLIAQRLTNAFNHADLGSAIVSARIGLTTLTKDDRSIHHVIQRARATRFTPEESEHGVAYAHENAATGAIAA